MQQQMGHFVKSRSNLAPTAIQARSLEYILISDEHYSGSETLSIIFERGAD